MRYILFPLMLLITLCSCDPGRIYEENAELEGVWYKDSLATFQFDIQKKDSFKVFLNVRNTLEYPYQNLYVRYYLKDTLGNLLTSDLVDIQLFDPKTGKPLGEGSIGDIYGHQKEILRGYKLEPKAYQMNIQHYMRTDSLQDILAIGLRVQENNDNE